VQASSVALKLANHADVPGVAAGGVYTFTVPIDDSVAPAGTTTTVSFQIVASDGAGHAATLNGNPAGVIRVDRDKPQITAIAITTTPDFAPGDGRKFFDAPGTSIKVQANIADGAGLDEATVCLRVAGEAGACPHLGSNHGAGSIYFFDMPRPAGTFDGTEIDFTISADDALAAVAETSKAEHQGTSPGQPVFFDNTPPVVVVTADTNVYARNGGPIDVTATITDGTGLSGTPSLSGATASAPATTTDNVHFVFHLSALSAPALTEGDFNFQIAAHDLLGHQTLAPATRRIDGAAPTISNLKIFRGDVVPTAPGVTFPAAVPNTGWNGSTFIYSDTVHVQGTLTDLSGIGSAVVHLDGLNLTGGNSTGTAQSLGCAPAATSCNFGVDITLNAAGSTFHTGTNTVNIGVTVGDIPSGILQFVIDAQDTATSFAGTAAPNLGTQKTPARATRLLWQRSFGLATSLISGLAIHPDGDLIVTVDNSTADPVFSVSRDLGTQHWSFGTVASGATQALGGVFGTPAIGQGAGDGTNGTDPRIYIASDAGNFYALNPDGSKAWEKVTTASEFDVGPAVTRVIASNPVEQIVVPEAGSSVAGFHLWRATSASDVSQVTTDNRDFLAAPLILNGRVYFGTQNRNNGPTVTHVTMHTIGADGALGTTINNAAVDSGAVPYFGLLSDGTNVFAASAGSTTGVLFGLTPTLGALGTFTNTALTSSLAAEPTIGIDGKLYGADLAKAASTFNATTGAKSALVLVPPLNGIGMVPLQGSDGHVYFPRASGQAVVAYEGTQLSWQLKTPANTLFFATMDCEGRLFSAAGNIVYALITDDAGLADTPWPNLRRDSRNTGNASTGWPKYGMRTIGPTPDGLCLQ